MGKIYGYADESGQDTKGRLFIVAVVVVGENIEELLTRLEELETTSGKEKFKWGKAKNDQRLAYLRAVVSDARFHGALRYAIFRQTKDYDAATIEEIARALHFRAPEGYSASIYIDGLAKTKRREYALRLRKLGVGVDKVRGVRRDENNALTRLADAVAGFVRDRVEDQDREVQRLFENVTRRGYLTQL